MSLLVGVLSTSRFFLSVVHGFCLPSMIPLWCHEARQKGDKKNLIIKRDHLLSTTGLALAYLGHRENTNGLKDPAVIWSAAVLLIALCQLYIWHRL